MAYPRQITVQKRLEADCRRQMRRMENNSIAVLSHLWDDARTRLKGAIMARHGGRTWTLAKAQQKGLSSRLQEAIREELRQFKAMAIPTMRDGLKANYKGEMLRQAWMVDVLTPPNVMPKATLHPHYREAVTVYSGRNAATAWYTRFGAWADAWGSSLSNNLMLNAMHGGDANSFSKEVDATKVGTPGLSLWDIFLRIYTSEILAAQAEARDDFADENGELLYDEIWQTMDDEKVCEICGPLDGMSMEDVDEPMPAHPNCRCFSRVVPKKWADLADRDTAREMDRLGLVPDAMIIRGENGIIKGAAIVSFDQWLKGRAQIITSGMGA